MIENAYTIGKTNHIVETRNIESVANPAITALIKDAIPINVKRCPEARSSNKGKVRSEKTGFYFDLTSLPMSSSKMGQSALN